MADHTSSDDSGGTAAATGVDSGAGSVSRYVAALAAAGAIGVVWAIIWETVYVRTRVDLAWCGIPAAAAIALTVRRIWGIGGGSASVTALAIALVTACLGHLMLFEHYALAQQAADDIGIAPSFRSVMAHLSSAHWVLTAIALLFAGMVGQPRPTGASSHDGGIDGA